MKRPMVSDVFLSSGGKLFHTDGPATEILSAPKARVMYEDLRLQLHRVQIRP